RSAARSAAWSAARSAAFVEFTSHAIDAWRRIAELDAPVDITADAVNDALNRIG
ncbi:hypothetical protein LX14_004071, partial [Williamsia deligens]|nr:hypothetical protein [Williamsia deligens]